MSKQSLVKNILAINTSTRECSVALLVGDSEFTASEYSERGHDGIVLALIDQVLKQAELTKSQIDLIAFGRGPGAFTGIRVATAVTQGLAVGLNIKVVPVSDLMNIAYQQFLETGAQSIITCIDARMGEIYAAVFEVKQGVVSALQDEQLIKPSVWPQSLEPFLSMSVNNERPKLIGVGNGFQEFPELVKQIPLDLERSNFTLFPTALITAKLAVLHIDNGFKAVSAIDALPVYLRNDVAHKKQSG